MSARFRRLLTPPLHRREHNPAMTTQVLRDSPLPMGILRLPNELLFDVASLLSITDLRRLSRVNHQLYFFVRAYLVEYRYNEGIVTMPNEIILEIIQHLDPRSCSRLARSSQRFYPLVMNFTIHRNIKLGGSSILCHAAKRNHKGLARKILSLGGDVNTQTGPKLPRGNLRSTPLTTAAYSGHERMVRLFLGAGALQIIDGARLPLAAILAMARTKAHENIIILLAQDVDASYQFSTTGKTLLDYACEKQFVHLVRHLLERDARQSRPPNHEEIHTYSTALYRLLESTECRADFVIRQLLEDVHQIALMLLQHEADPDLPIARARPLSVSALRYGPDLRASRIALTMTARESAARNPDPRIRNFLSKAKVTDIPRELRLQIGRSSMSQSQGQRSRMGGSQSSMSPIESGHYATLSSFLQKPITQTSTDDEDSDSTTGNQSFDFSAIAELVARDMRELTKKQGITNEPPTPLSSFPQLDAPKPNIRESDRLLWARIPTSAKMPPATSNFQKASVRTESSTSKSATRSVTTEPFPQLGQPGQATDQSFWAQIPASVKSVSSVSSASSVSPTKNPNERLSVGRMKSVEKTVQAEIYPQLGGPAQNDDHAKDIWACFPKKKGNGTRSVVDDHQVLPQDAYSLTEDLGRKKSKNKKWAPLQI